MYAPSLPHLSQPVRQNLIANVLSTVPVPAGVSPAAAQAIRDSALAEAEALAPEDAIEALMVAQIVAYSRVALRLLGMAPAEDEDGPAVDPTQRMAMAMSRTATHLLRIMQQRRKAAQAPMRAIRTPVVKEQKPMTPAATTSPTPPDIRPPAGAPTLPLRPTIRGLRRAAETPDPVPPAIAAQPPLSRSDLLRTAAYVPVPVAAAAMAAAE
jgi:hypothetical protein